MSNGLPNPILFTDQYLEAILEELVTQRGILRAILRELRDQAEPAVAVKVEKGSKTTAPLAAAKKPAKSSAKKKGK